MTWNDVARLALETLRLHRLRTGLTVVAVGIGVTAVLLLTALGDAAKRYVIGQFAAVGTNLVMVLPGKTETAGMGMAITGGTHPLTLEDCEAIRRRATAITLTAPLSIGSAQVEHGVRHRDVFVLGSTDAYAPMRNLALTSGEFLPPGDPARGERVAVLGTRLARELFAGANPLGATIRIATARFRVIGVLAPKGQSLGIDFDDVAIVPVGSAMRLFNQSSLFRIAGQAKDATSIPVAIEQVRAILADRHREEDFTLITQDAMLKSFRSIIDALTIGLAGIAAISLAVAGIGIMNVMLVSVSERVAEVGLLKALGGQRRQITRLFLAEALLLSALGALAGIGAGLVGMRIATGIFPALPLVPSGSWIAAVVMLSLALGGVFGLIPARRAARLDAVEALRGRR
jgi:putative ABC transport system permease protein